MEFWVLAFTFSLGFSAKSQVSFDEYYHERSIFYQNEVDTEDPDTYPKKFARIQYFHEDRACDDQSSEMTLLPMHNAYEQLVLNGQNGGPTHKTILESDIAYLQGALSRMRQDYLRLTLLWNVDEADWDDAVNRLVADSANTATLIGALINKSDLVQADALLQTLPKTRDADKAVHAILEARIDGDHCPRYTPQQLSLLQSVADDLDSDASALAYSALMPITGEVVDIPLPFPSSKRVAQSEQLIRHTIPFLKVFPNPANDVVNLVFKAPDPETRCRFILEDNQGRRILELNDIRNGIAEFSVGRLPSGMYFGRLIFDNTVIATEKITVVR